MSSPLQYGLLRRRSVSVTVAGSLLVLTGCLTIQDPATREEKVSTAVTTGAGEAVKAAALCGAVAWLSGGSGKDVVQSAALCGAAAGVAGYAAGSRADALDRELLAEFEKAGLKVVVRGETLVLDAERQVTFAESAVVPDSAGRALVDSLAKIVGRFPQRDLQLIGHTSTDENAPLAQARAKAVASMLSKRGVDPARIRSEGKGAKEPLVASDAKISAHRNRRVEVFFVPPYAGWNEASAPLPEEKRV
jgi:outer membrane protein OmpA-like peptidoglycan-associated protein